jgi:hypothetical protein
MADSKKIWLGIAAGQMSSAGGVLRSLDSDDKGSDDMAGKLLMLGGAACQSLAFGNDKSFDASLRLIVDSINSYLGQPTPPAPVPGK